MVRSRIGPFALESPMGDRGSSTYRAIHLQQKTHVALRLMSVPLGMTAEGKKRFMEEMERQKELRHDHIARCFGGGVDGNDVYVVHELVGGESLADRLKRVERLPWESALQCGLQLCSALQFAHNAGWLHEHLNPSQIVFDPAGENVKLIGYKGEVVRRLSNRPLGVTELAYQSPEQFNPPVTPHPAIDIYSLGAVLYHTLTGQPPFANESINALRASILEEAPPQVASIVFDCPVWLSKIVEQLLNKNPVQRPFTAAAVSMALREAEKRAMSGASVVEHAVGGFSPLQMNLDKEEAEKVLGVRPKKSKKKADVPLFERPLVLIASIAAAIALIAFFMMPLSEEQMYERAASLMAETENEAAYYAEARDKYLLPMLSRFPDGKHAAWAQEQLDLIAMRSAESRMARHERLRQDPDSEGERRYSEARRYEQFGDRITALDKYRAIVELYQSNEDERAFVNLSRRQIAAIEAKPPDEAELLAFLNTKLDEADQMFAGGDVSAAKKVWDSVISLYNGNAEMVSVVSRAQLQLDKMKEVSRPRDQ